MNSGEENRTEQQPRSDTYRLILVALFLPAAFVLQYVFWNSFKPFAWIFFYPAVFFSAWIGGLRCGLASIVFSSLVIWWFFIPNRYSFIIEQPAYAFTMVVFVSMGVLFSFTFERLRKANQQVTDALATISTARDQLEERVSERTAELERTFNSLRESEVRYRSLFESAKDGILILDAETGMVIDVNPFLIALLGFSHEEFLGKKVWERGFLGDIVANQASFSELQHQQYIRYEDKPLETADGRRIDVEFVSNVYLVNNQKVIQCNIRDISERKWLDKALRESEERFRVAQEVSPDGFTILRPVRDAQNRVVDFTWLYENAAIARLNGTNPQAVLGRSLLELFPSHRGSLFLKAYQQVAETGESVIFEENYHGETISERTWFRIIVVPTGGDIAILAQDITERKRTENELKKSEELYRSLFENMLNGYAYCRMYFEQNRPHDFVYINVNRAFESLTGLKNVVGKKASEAIPGIRESDPELFEIYGRVALTGEPEQFEKYIIALQMWFSVSVYSPAKEYFISIFDVITERKQSEEVLQASREQMRALAGRLQEVREEERTNIAREIHDELGGALTGMKVDVSFLIKSALKIKNEAPRASMLAGIDSISKSLDTTIHAVRKIAMELRPGILDDLGLVAALEWQLKDFQKRTGIRCKFFPPVEDISLDADLSTALFRIFQEALTNVARHSGATEVRARLLAEADFSTLVVEDNGKGIEKEEILRKESLGILGMRERAQMFGGRITVTGTPGTGTTVVVKISSQPQRRDERDLDQEGDVG